MPRDGIYFMHVAVGVAASLVLLVALALIAIEIWAPAPKRVAMPAAKPEYPLAHPLECDFTMYVTVGGRLMQRPVCYVATRVWL